MRDGVRADAGPILYRPVPAWRARSRLLPGHHSLSDILVSFGAARPDHRDVHDRDGHRLRDRRSDFRRDYEIFQRHRGLAWLAVALHFPGLAGVDPRSRRLFLSPG